MLIYCIPTHRHTNTHAPWIKTQTHVQQHQKMHIELPVHKYMHKAPPKCSDNDPFKQVEGLTTEVFRPEVTGSRNSLHVLPAVLHATISLNRLSGSVASLTSESPLAQAEELTSHMKEKTAVTMKSWSRKRHFSHGCPQHEAGLWMGSKWLPVEVLVCRDQWWCQGSIR